MAKARRRPSRPLPEIVGERIQAIRTAAGLPRSRVAADAQIALSSLNLIEAGRVSANLATLQSVARVLGVRVAELLAEESSPEPTVTNTKVFSRIVQRLRAMSESRLRSIEKLIVAFERETGRQSEI